MSYEHAISEIVKVVEATGAGIMVIGGLGSFIVFAARVPRSRPAQGQDSHRAEFVRWATETWSVRVGLS